MVSLYSMLFADDHYDEEDSIVFDWNPMWWGMGPEKYSYNRSKLQETVLTQMGQNGWMGTCCEPNMVFIVCNQFPVCIRFWEWQIINIDNFIANCVSLQ